MTKRLLEVDLLKGLAIVAVVVMHGMSGAQQMRVGTAFHIAQAVPVFLLLMALNAASSFDRRFPGAPLVAIYRSTYLWRRLWRLLMPLAIAVTAATLIGVAKGAPLYFGPLTAVGWMPVPLVGQFFIVISVLFVVIAPVLYVAYRRAPEATVVACIAADLAFEIVAPHIGVLAETYYLYQVMPFRFLALFGLGMWLADGADPASRRNRFIAPFAAASLAYLVAFQTGLRLPLFNYEQMYNVLAFGYPLLLVSAGLTWSPSSTRSAPLLALAAFGRASYHIFLVQAIWFSGPITLVAYGNARWMPVSLVVCCGVGWLWFRSEQYALRKKPPVDGSDGPFEDGLQVD